MAKPLLTGELWDHIAPPLPSRSKDSSQRLGRHRWVVERTHAWMNRFRRLVVRCEERDDIRLAFASSVPVPPPSRTLPPRAPMAVMTY